MTETERCGATVVLYPDEEHLVYICDLPKGHDGEMGASERWHFNRGDEAAWKGDDADTVEYQDV